MNDINELDLRLLAYFEVLVREGSVSKAAYHLNMSQPGLSSALSKLRLLMNDPLLVRTPQGMTPTPCGLALANEYASIKDRLGAIVSENTEFDPARSRRVFRIECLDYAMNTDVVDIIALVRSAAPGIKIIIQSILDRSFREHLETGYADLIIGYLPELDDTLKVTKLREVPSCGIVHRDHPLFADGLNEEAFYSGQHVGLMLGGGGAVSLMEAVLDAAFRARGYDRHVPVYVQSHAAIPHVVAKTDLIGVIATDLAVSMAQQIPIKTFELPFPLPKAEFSLVWHTRCDKDPAHRWLRGLIRGAASTARIPTL